MGFNFAFKELKPAQINGSLRKNLRSFIISLLVLPRMRNVSYRFVQEFKTHILSSIILLSDIHAFNETRWKKIHSRGRQTTDNNIIRRMRILY